MVGDALPGSRTALVRLFATKPSGVLDDLAGRADTAMRVLFDSASAGLLLVDRAGRIARANPALRAMLHAEVDLSAGGVAVSIFAPDDRTAASAKIQALLAGRAEDCRLSAQLLLADPAPDHRAEIGCRPIHEEDGTTSGLLLHVTDITAPVRLQAQLAQSNELETVGLLVAGVAHDFNNLLTTILGAVELAQERNQDTPIHTELEHIRRGAERGAALVRNLLALSRQQYLQAMPLDVNAVLRDFATTIRSMLGSNVALDLALEEPGRRVRADPGQLDQVLTNLTLNAQHAMPHGGRLTLRSGHATLYRKQVHGRETIPPGRYVTIAVQDTGTGIAPDLLGRIFEPFFTTRRAQGGTGLGLATAHGIIRQSGGYLTVDSAVGVGTIFRIYLPREEVRERSELPTERVRSTAPAQTMPTSERRLLLVDDEQTVRRVTARALAKRGWSVLEAESAEAALALLDTDPGVALAAVVSDVVMPGQDGAALVAAVRARYPGLPAILVSGYAEGMLADRDTGIAFLGKPYTPKTLLARLNEIAPTSAPSVVRQHA
jgi:two-component system, cell cycle sensor histidine kinase and response regulator CckA